MKVLYITTAFPRYEGDVITPWLVETIKRLKERGIETEVFTSSYKGLRDQKIYGINTKRFRYFLKKWEDLTHEETTPDRLKRGIRYKILVLFYLLGGIIGIIRLCKKGSYDIIHVHWPFPHAIFGYLAKNLCNAKMVSSFYGVGLKWIKNKMPFFIPFLKWAINKSDAVTAISTYTAREINEIIDKKKVTVIPFGAAITGTQPVAQGFSLATKNHSPNILFVGRLVERKGVKYLIEALDICRHEFPAKRDLPHIAGLRQGRDAAKGGDNSCSTILTIVGEGPERANLEQLVTKMGLSHRVTFTGRISHDELKECYKNCDVFVLPACIDSKGDTEGLGVVLIEAMSYKKPVIASRVGGIVDIIKDRETGLLVPEKNPIKLADAIYEVLDNKALANRLGEAGEKFIKANFSWEKIIDKLIETYNEVI